MVQPGQVVLQFRNIQKLEVTISVAENDMVSKSIRIGSTATVRFLSAPDSLYPARLKEWRAEADQMTRTYAITFEFKAPEGLLILPGMSAEVVWEDAATLDDVIAIPMTALCKDQDGTSFLWVYDSTSQRAKKTPVQTKSLVNSFPRGRDRRDQSRGSDRSGW